MSHTHMIQHTAEIRRDMSRDLCWNCVLRFAHPYETDLVLSIVTLCVSNDDAYDQALLWSTILSKHISMSHFAGRWKKIYVNQSPVLQSALFMDRLALTFCPMRRFSCTRRSFSSLAWTTIFCKNHIRSTSVTRQWKGITNKRFQTREQCMQSASRIIKLMRCMPTKKLIGPKA